MGNVIPSGQQPYEQIQRGQSAGFQTGAVGQQGKKATGLDDHEISDRLERNTDSREMTDERNKIILEENLNSTPCPTVHLLTLLIKGKYQP
jgi:hypothetical protein